METIEKNKKIGDFMEWKTPSIEVVINNTRTITFPNGYEFNDKLKYHSSWDWLMPVVEKIESLGCKVEIAKNICKIYISENAVITIHSLQDNKIEAVYTACVEFIERNKENKK